LIAAVGCRCRALSVVAGLLVLGMLAACSVVALRARRQRKDVADHAAAVLRRDWVQQLREP
jgi:uncharacterized lipoprotein